MKKKKMKKRTPMISIELREDVHINWSDKENCIELLNSKGEISEKHLVSIAEIYHRNRKGPKVVRQVNSQPGAAIHLRTSSVSYDRYVAIDTSYKDFGENKMCVTAALCSDESFREKKEPDESTLRIYPRLCFLSKRDGVNPERYAWKVMIDALIKSREFNSNFSYGIIVDSDLESLQKINAGEESIFEGFTLPENISMIYASADTGTECFLNKLIRAADGIAARSLETALEIYAGDENFALETDFLYVDQLSNKDNPVR